VRGTARADLSYQHMRRRIRALVFPLRMRNGKPMPLSVMLLAWSFCAYNGFLQSLSLAHVYEYRCYASAGCSTLAQLSHSLQL
jgi:hypothetical protein